MLADILQNNYCTNNVKKPGKYNQFSKPKNKKK